MRRVRNAWMIGLAAFALTAGAACERRSADEQQRAATTAQTGDESSSEAAMTTSVQAAFYGDDTVRGNAIDVTTDDGVVTLRGTVESETVRQQAASLAQQVNGVDSVNNQLQVQGQAGTVASREGETPAPAAGEQPQETGTSGRTDDARLEPAWVTTKIQAQYFVAPRIKPWNIDVTTSSGGVVTLQGEVESAADKAEAIRIARETEGVTRVEDRLRVKAELAEREAEPAPGTGPAPRGMQPDAWLTAKIQAKYFLDDEVKGRDIDVDTHEGVVTLKGTVASEAERRQAVALARNTDGVRDVNDQLEVQPQTTGREVEEPRQRVPSGTTIPPVTPVVDDTWITTKIQSKYFIDREVKGRQINVEARDGVVTLTGTVETEQEKEQAERIARETDGVSKVINNLVVGKR